jgi:hypothetical protein
LELEAPVAARLLTHVNPQRVLANEAPEAVPPVRVPRGPLGRLRELLRGRR